MKLGRDTAAVVGLAGAAEVGTYVALDHTLASLAAFGSVLSLGFLHLRTRRARALPARAAAPPSLSSPDVAPMPPRISPVPPSPTVLDDVAGALEDIRRRLEDAPFPDVPRCREEVGEMRHRIDALAAHVHDAELQPRLAALAAAVAGLHDQAQRNHGSSAAFDGVLAEGLERLRADVASISGAVRSRLDRATKDAEERAARLAAVCARIEEKVASAEARLTEATGRASSLVSTSAEAAASQVDALRGEVRAMDARLKRFADHAPRQAAEAIAPVMERLRELEARLAAAATAGHEADERLLARVLESGEAAASRTTAALRGSESRVLEQMRAVQDALRALARPAGPGIAPEVLEDLASRVDGVRGDVAALAIDLSRQRGSSDDAARAEARALLKGVETLRDALHARFDDAASSEADGRAAEAAAFGRLEAAACSLSRDLGLIREDVASAVSSLSAATDAAGERVVAAVARTVPDAVQALAPRLQASTDAALRAVHRAAEVEATMLQRFEAADAADEARAEATRRALAEDLARVEKGIAALHRAAEGWAGADAIERLNEALAEHAADARASTERDARAAARMESAQAHLAAHLETASEWLAAARADLSSLAEAQDGATSRLASDLHGAAASLAHDIAHAQSTLASKLAEAEDRAQRRHEASTRAFATLTAAAGDLAAAQASSAAQLAASQDSTVARVDAAASALAARVDDAQASLARGVADADEEAERRHDETGQALCGIAEDLARLGSSVGQGFSASESAAKKRHQATEASLRQLGSRVGSSEDRLAARVDAAQDAILADAQERTRAFAAQVAAAAERLDVRLAGVESSLATVDAPGAHAETHARLRLLHEALLERSSLMHDAIRETQAAGAAGNAAGWSELRELLGALDRRVAALSAPLAHEIRAVAGRLDDAAGDARSSAADHAESISDIRRRVDAGFERADAREEARQDAHAEALAALDALTEKLRRAEAHLAQRIDAVPVQLAQAALDRSEDQAARHDEVLASIGSVADALDATRAEARATDAALATSHERITRALGEQDAEAVKRDAALRGLLIPRLDALVAGSHEARRELAGRLDALASTLAEAAADAEPLEAAVGSLRDRLHALALDLRSRDDARRTAQETQAEQAAAAVSRVLDAIASADHAQQGRHRELERALQALSPVLDELGARIEGTREEAARAAAAHESSSAERVAMLRRDLMPRLDGLRGDLKDLAERSAPLHEAVGAVAASLADLSADVRARQDAQTAWSQRSAEALHASLGRFFGSLDDARASLAASASREHAELRAALDAVAAGTEPLREMVHTVATDLTALSDDIVARQEAQLAWSERNAQKLSTSFDRVLAALDVTRASLGETVTEGHADLRAALEDLASGTAPLHAAVDGVAVKLADLSADLRAQHEAAAASREQHADALSASLARVLSALAETRTSLGASSAAGQAELHAALDDLGARLDAAGGSRHEALVSAMGMIRDAHDAEAARLRGLSERLVAQQATLAESLEQAAVRDASSFASLQALRASHDASAADLRSLADRLAAEHASLLAAVDAAEARDVTRGAEARTEWRAALDRITSDVEAARAALEERLADSERALAGLVAEHSTMAAARHQAAQSALAQTGRGVEEGLHALSQRLEAHARDIAERSAQGSATIGDSLAALHARIDELERTWREDEAKRDAAQADREARARLRLHSFGDSLVAGQNAFHAAVSEALDAMSRRLDERAGVPHVALAPPPPRPPEPKAAPAPAASPIDVDRLLEAIEARLAPLLARDEAPLQALASRVDRADEELAARAASEAAWARRLEEQAAAHAQAERLLAEKLDRLAAAQAETDRLWAERFERLQATLLARLAAQPPPPDVAQEALHATLSPREHFRGVDAHVEARMTEVETNLEALHAALTGGATLGDAGVGDLLRATRAGGERIRQLVDEVRRESAGLAARLKVADDGVQQALAACEAMERAAQ